MQSRIKYSKLPSFEGPFSRNELDRVDTNHPTASGAEKYRSMLAYRLIDWHERHRGPKPRRAVAR